MFELFDRFEPPRAPHAVTSGCASCVHPDDATASATARARYLTSAADVLEIEFRIAAQGRQRPLGRPAGRRRPRARGRRRVLGIAMDVTERHAALDALRDASERAALIARHAGIGTWETRLDGSRAAGTSRCSTCAASRRGPARRTARSGWRWSIPTTCRRVARGPGAEREHRCCPWPTSSASACPTAATAGSRRARPRCSTSSGRPVRRVGVNWDITEASNAELARQQAAARRAREPGQVAVPLAHEPRAAHAAQRGARLHPAAADRGAPIRATASQLAKLEHIRAAGEHLLVADQRRARPLRPGGRRAPLALQPVDLGDARPPVAAAGATRSRRSTASRSRSAALAARRSADPTRLRQVLINLLSNAIKYNRPGGQVVVEPRRPATARRR